MRQSIKTISIKPEKYIPKGQDEALKEDAKEVADRPLVMYWRKLSREDRYNLSSLVETKDVSEVTMVRNLGTVARYVWDNCVVEVCNVLLDDGTFESLKGVEKNRLFNTSGMDSEIADTIRHIQEQSRFTEAEAKN